MNESRVLVTGSRGFIGRNLMVALGRTDGVAAVPMLRENRLAFQAKDLGVVFHLAGVNRPDAPAEFETGNVGFTRQLCMELERQEATPIVVLASSIQATQDNPYGRSKLEAEKAITDWARRCGGRAIIFRLQNAFGKWCRPNYNSVVATYCYNVAREIPLKINDPAREIELVYIDDIVRAFIESLGAPLVPGEARFSAVTPSHRITVGALATRIESFRGSRLRAELPEVGDELTKKLYSTYLSALPETDFAYALEQKSDQRGTLAEFIKGASFGQIFVSRTKPGFSRGNHFHHTKVEKFLVLEGTATIKLRPIGGDSIVSIDVRGHQFRVVDIPPGYTHSIENSGPDELVVLFWANERFEPLRPDTYAEPVDRITPS